jgi:hypothetical protein
MKKLLLAVSILLALAILIPSTVMAGVGRQNWQLNKTVAGSGVYQMAKYPGPNAGQANNSITLSSNGGSQIWIADQISQGVTFPQKGIWYIDLNTDMWEDANTNCLAVVGVWNNGTFIPITTILHGLSSQSGSNAWIIKYEFNQANFTVPSGQYLALMVTNASTTSHMIYTGAGTSTLASPQTDPGYPTPEVATIVLLGLGMAGLGTFVVIKRKKAVSKI